MTRFRAFPPSQRLLRALTKAFAAASVPTLALAQQTGANPAANRSLADENAPVNVSAEKMTGRPDREVILERNVEITRGPTTINSDQATYNILEDEVEAAGNIRMRRFGDTYTGDELKLKIDTGQGYLLHPGYHLQRSNGQGKADRIDFEAQDRAVVHEGTYSTCEGPDPDWYLKSDSLSLDTGRDIGTARDTVVYFKGVPILGSPSMSFPMSSSRKSGFLPPAIGTTNKGGLEVTVPYYLNIAPNRDLTLYPRVFARRGVQLGAEGRYLSENYFGQTRVEVLPDDQQTKTTRWAITSTHTQSLAALTPGLSYAWNVNAASDDNYPSDFSRTITASAQRLLLRDVSLNYGSSYWGASARLSNFQVLQDPLAPILAPYDRLPQINMFAARQDVAGFDLNVDSELTRFWHPDLIRGDRFVFNPRVAYPIIHPGYFITPKLSLHATKYVLENTGPGTNLASSANPASSTPDNLNRVLPTFSLDSGLVFERDAKFFGSPMTQTLEPRLFYVRTPFRDQSQFPNFDSAEADLSFAQLFSENRFIGNDRISDANQLTAAVVSRYIEPSGIERMRFAVGQRFYFTPPRVTLGLPTDQSRSDLLLSAAGNITQTLSTDANLQYSQSLNTTTRANYGVRWQPAPGKVLNLRYRRDLPNKLELVDVSGQWPIARRWYGVGRVNYSLPDRKIAEGLAGLEYKADCWIFRVVAQRIPTATGQVTSALYFQLELSGLTRLGSNPMEALRTSVPGYQPISIPNNPYTSPSNTYIPNSPRP